MKKQYMTPAMVVNYVAMSDMLAGSRLEFKDEETSDAWVRKEETLTPWQGTMNREW